MNRFGTTGELSSLLSDDTYTPDVQRARRRAMQSERTWSRSLRDAVDKVTPPEARNDATVVWEQRSADEKWVLRWVLAEQGAELAVRSLTIEAADLATPAGGITANILRELSPAGVCSAASEARTDLLSSEAELRAGGLKVIGETEEGLLVVDESAALAMTLRWDRRDAHEHGPKAAERRRPGRPALTDDFLASVAVAYLEELPRGRGVLARVATRLETELQRKPGTVPVETVRDWVRSARREGYLGPAPKQGKRGGSPGPRLLELLDKKGGRK